jgi:hypothetical protein
MWNWFTSLLSDLHWQDVLLGVGLFVLMFALSLAEVAFILVKLPARYFTDEYRRFRQDRHISWRRVLLAIGKNLLGLAHIALGIVLSLPGIPGQGALTILLGVMMMDLPGVRALERWLVSRTKVRRAVDRIRTRFGKLPLVLDGDANDTHAQHLAKADSSRGLPAPALQEVSPRQS